MQIDLPNNSFENALHKPQNCSPQNRKQKTENSKLKTENWKLKTQKHKTEQNRGLWPKKHKQKK